MEYKCPLCGQPVSPKLWQKITGIWEARQKALAEIKKERAKLREEKRRFQEQLREQRLRFQRERERLVREAVEKQAKRFKRQMELLKRRERLVKQRALERIAKITKEAHEKARKEFEAKFRFYEERLRASTNRQLREEREKMKKEFMKLAEEKYKRARQSLDNAILQIQIKNRQLSKARQEIEELKRQLKRQTTPQLEGLLDEKALAEELRKRFRGDKVYHTGKGGDVIQHVILDGERVGTIVYECKRVKHYSSAHVIQAARAKKTRNADFAVLVTNAMKRGTHGFFVERGVMVVHPTGVLPLVGIIRNHTIEIARMKLGRELKDKAVRLVLEYLEGPEFTNSMDEIIQESLGLQRELIEEIERHQAAWKKRYEAHVKIRDEAFAVKEKSRALLSGKPEEKPVELSDVPEIPPLPEIALRPLTKKKAAA